MAHHEAPVSDSVEWYTPKWIFDALKVDFDLDPCAPMNKQSYVPALIQWNKEDDGLAHDWGDNFFFCNPPYGREAMAWLDKAIKSNNGLFLITARTETRLFQKALRHCNLVFLFNKRIAFHAGDRDGQMIKGNTIGNAIFAFGPRATKALYESELQGTYLTAIHQVREK